MAKNNDEKLFLKLCKKVGYSLKKYHLLEPADKIMIGVSGGKDSLFLLEAMAERKKHLPFPIELLACHITIKEIGYKIDNFYLENLCKALDVTYYHLEVSVNLHENPKKTPCFVCSWHRRKKLFELTKELNCNKLALGHHKDDALETLLLNMIYHGSISSMPATLKMFDGRMHLIRPLIELTNDEIAEISILRQYPQLKAQCPYGDKTKRSEIKNLVKSMGTLNKNAKKNLFRSMGNIFGEYLPVAPNQSEIIAKNTQTNEYQ